MKQKLQSRELLEDDVGNALIQRKSIKSEKVDTANPINRTIQNIVDALSQKCLF